MARSSDVKVREVEVVKERVAYRSPLKFGGVPTTHATIVTVRLRVEGLGGRSAWGSGSMPLGNVWSWPSKVLPAAETAAHMEAFVDRLAAALGGSDERGHPLDLGHRWEARGLALGADFSRELKLAEPISPLAVLVCASPFDAALHDAFGKFHARHVYECYGPEWVEHDLGDFLDERFAGEQVSDYARTRPKDGLPLYHLVGALDPLVDGDVRERLEDGLPNTLIEWVRKDELSHLKIKLNGNDAGWDVDRILGVDRAALEAAPGRAFTYSLDFNEQCPHADYLLEVLRRVKEGSPAAFDRTAYVEQPTKRDLRAHPENRMHAAAALKPVVIDESLVDYESLLRARELGYSGVALKSCKGQTQSLLMAAAAQKFGMFLCVQDLTCPGQSFLQSAGLAAHIGPVTAIEGNARQYCPSANTAWARLHPEVFTIRGGRIRTGELSGPGLGHRLPDDPA
jgi:L-alanine-DL-glutamate epimerase-like enolase superfamily enzyme